MTTYLSDFSEFSVGGGSPPGFTRYGSAGNPSIVEDASSPGGKKLVYENTFSARSWLLRTAEAASTQIKVRTLFTPAVTGGGSYCGLVIARGDSTRSGFETGVRTLEGEQHAGPRRSDDNIHTGGTSFTQPYAWVVGTRYESLFEAVGSSIRYRVWEAGNPEPVVWLVDLDDPTHPSGIPGLGGDAPGVIDFHAWSYGTDGDDAPLLSESENYDPASLDVVVAETSATLDWPAPQMSDADFTDIFRRGPYATEGAVDNSPFDPKASTRIDRVSVGTLTYQDTPSEPGWYAWQVFPVKLGS